MAETPKAWKRWERTRVMGERSFVWRVGVLGFGGALTLLWCSRSLVNPELRSQLPTLILQALLVTPLAGYWWGMRMWRTMESRYEEMRRGI